jgi:glycerol kinase
VAAPTVLVVDLGTTSTRLSVVTPSGAIVAMRRVRIPTVRDPAGRAGWDGAVLAATVRSEAAALLGTHPVMGLAIANQRASCVVWDAATHRPIGPVIGWSDGRTRDLDKALRAQGAGHVPGLTASKAAWLLREAAGGARVDGLRAGTLDSWLLWCLTEGALHATDHTNASHTGVFDASTLDWRVADCDALGLPRSLLPGIRPSTGPFARATALPGAPRVLCLVGDQQAALMGHGCIARGSAKVTFGTGAIANVVLGDAPLPAHSRTAFGNVAWSRAGTVAFGAESAVQSAGSSVEWLVGLGLLDAPESLDAVVDPDRRDGVATFVPSIEGLGAPDWMPDARGVLAGLSSADGRAQVARAVLDGIACATAEVIEDLERSSGVGIDAIAIDGGLTRSHAFTGILAATCGRRLTIAPQPETTTLGAARLAFEAAGIAFDVEPTVVAGRPAAAAAAPADRAAWRDARSLAVQEATLRRRRYPSPDSAPEAR